MNFGIVCADFKNAGIIGYHFKIGVGAYLIIKKAKILFINGGIEFFINAVKGKSIRPFFRNGVAVFFIIDNWFFLG